MTLKNMHNLILQLAPNRKYKFGLNMKKILAALALVLSSSAFAITDSLTIDQYASPYMGADLNLAIYRSYMYVDDHYFNDTEGSKGVGWFMVRGCKLALDDVISEVLMVVQHEVFGHGYRLREYDFSVIGYKIGIGHGSTGYSLSEFNTLSYPRRAALSAAGMEANAIFSQKIRENWILDNIVDRREAILYFITYLDQSEYILGTSDESTNLGNDINSYVIAINAWYGNTQLTKSKLRNYALWDFLDPSLYMSLFSMVRYLDDGDPHVPMFMFDKGTYKYNFCGRLLMAPYGPEFQIQNYVLMKKNKQLWQLNVRYGNNSNIQSYGVDLWVKPLWKYKDWSFGNRLFLWYQPDYLKQNTAYNVGKSLGVGEFVSAEYGFNKNIFAIGEFGYKTAGYIQGIPLGNSWVWRVGFSLRY